MSRILGSDWLHTFTTFTNNCRFRWNIGYLWIAILLIADSKEEIYNEKGNKNMTAL
jgi:hypothetical protein